MFFIKRNAGGTIYGAFGGYPRKFTFGGLRLINPISSSSFMSSKDIRKLFKLPEPGKMTGTSFFSGRARRKQLMRNFNRKVEMKKIKKHYYRKAAENLPPLL